MLLSGWGILQLVQMGKLVLKSNWGLLGLGWRLLLLDDRVSLRSGLGGRPSLEKLYPCHLALLV